MLKLRRPRALALLLLVSMITTSCTAIDRYGSSSGNVTTSETLDDDTDLEWGGECEDVDLDDTDVLEGELDPCECEYVSAELTCADDEKIQDWSPFFESV